MLKLGSLFLVICLSAVIALPGCQARKAKSRKKGGVTVTHAHSHAGKGPNGGVVAEWGEEEYHVEFTVDHGKKQATVFVLDGTAKKPSAIQAESITLTLSNVTPVLEMVLKADPQADDPKGSSSRFSGTHEQLGKEMDFKGEISGKIGEKAYKGDFEEKDHP